MIYQCSDCKCEHHDYKEAADCCGAIVGLAEVETDEDSGSEEG